jgi:hypothetical protein
VQLAAAHAGEGRHADLGNILREEAVDGIAVAETAEGGEAFLMDIFKID